MVSVWSATAEVPQYEPLLTDRRADVVVVGGGWIGLTTALLLAQDGADVVVLEAGRIATRTSGNTTGKVTSQHSTIYADLLDRHGHDKAGLYAEANQAAIDQVAALVQTHGIDCELTRAPAFVYSTESESEIKREAEAAISLRLPAHLTDERELGLPAVAALRFDNQLHLHPVKYLAGIAKALTGAGGQIFEQTRVTDVDNEDDGVRISTEGGPQVRARHAVIATLLPIGMIGGYFAKTRPQQSHGIAVRLPVEAPAGMAISIDSPVRSTRPWPGGGPNGLIVVGGGHETGSEEDTEAIYQSLTDWVSSRWNHPCQPEYRWSAHDYSTADQLPYIGKTPGSDSIMIATGMHKWGLSNGMVAAGIFRELVAGRPDPWGGLYDAGRIGDVKAVAKLLKDNAKVGKEFAAGHLSRALHGGLDHLEVGQGGLFEIDGKTVGAYRDPDGQLHAVKPTCTHLGCPLNWNNADTSWDCNCHGSRFSYDGSILYGPATKPLDRS